MTGVTMTITGLEELQAKLGKLAAMQFLAPIIKASAEELKGLADVYPSASSANQPPAPYYKRGYGVVYASGKGKKTSQMMNRKWLVKASGFSATVVNTASYAQYVIGDRQAWFHQARGWKLITTAAQQESPRLVARIVSAIRALFYGPSNPVGGFYD